MPGLRDDLPEEGKVVIYFSLRLFVPRDRSARQYIADIVLGLAVELSKIV